MGGVAQESGATANDFSGGPVAYDVTAADATTTLRWTVSVTCDDPAPGPIDISGACFSAIPDQEWTGEPLEPAFTVTLEVEGQQVALDPATDYDVAWEGNTGPGEATVTVTGKGGYAGTASATFNIVRSQPPVEGRRAYGLSGANRYDTAAKAALAAFPLGSEWAIVATGAGFADALSAGGLAGLLGCPILLTAPGSLSPEAASALSQLGCTKVIVVGGTGAVSTACAKQIQATGDVEKVERVAGADRYATCQAIYEYGRDAAGGWRAAPVVASALNYPDALAAAPYCYAAGAPMLLVGGQLTDAQASALSSDWAGAQVAVLGGTGAVPAAVGTAIASATGTDPVRFAGADRYATAAAFAAWATEAGGMSFDGAVIATGANFPDALAAGPLAGSRGAVLLLVAPGSYGCADAAAPYGESIRSVTFAGGTGAVPVAVRNQVLERLGGGFEHVGW